MYKIVSFVVCCCASNAGVQIMPMLVASMLVATLLGLPYGVLESRSVLSPVLFHPDPCVCRPRRWSHRHRLLHLSWSPECSPGHLGTMHGHSYCSRSSAASDWVQAAREGHHRSCAFHTGLVVAVWVHVENASSDRIVVFVQMCALVTLRSTNEAIDAGSTQC